MSNLSGVPDNKTFRGSKLPGEPYYYIRANLDLSGVTLEDEGANVFYFNADNSFAYANKSKINGYVNPDTYPAYHLIDDNNVIGEVSVYSNPDLAASANLGQLSFSVGGLYRPSSQSTSMDVWGGPTGNSPGSLSAEEIAHGQVCYFGTEPDLDYDVDYRGRRYLGLKISDSNGQTLTKGNVFVVVKVYNKFA